MSEAVRANAATFADGRLRTGDLARIDAEGFARSSTEPRT